MIKIVNIAKDIKIIIDENLNGINLIRKDYDTPPHFILELNNFDFLGHAAKCDDCMSFINSFGKESLDWFLIHGNKSYRVDTSEMNKKGYGENKFSSTYSHFFSGTKIILKLHKLQSNDDLKAELKKLVDSEEYEEACIYRDFLSNI